jgi:hypothetical protein
MGEEIVERPAAQSRWERASTTESTAFDHAIVENGDGVAECTIFPRECGEETIVTNWLTASGDAFVALESVR